MSITIRFVGGPADGRTLTIPDAVPPRLYLIPLAPSIAELMATSLDPTPTKKAEYEPQWEDSRFRRAADGAYLYQHRPKPVTAEERDTLARSRAEARAAEQRRAVELDATWQEIRRERPHYPGDWRDL